MTISTQPMLFSQAELGALESPNATAESAKADGPAKASRAPRLNKPERFQGEFRSESLDQRLDADHEARLVWNLTLGLDLSPLYQRIEAVEGGVGRNATDPRVLFALWLYAAVDGVGSARELERLCNEHRAYEWLRGGVPINYHMLSDFRVQHGALLKQLQVDSLAGMLAEGLLTLETVAQDGMRVRASAGSSSFRRRPTLDEAQREAREHLEEIEAAEEEAAGTPRQKKARERAARERLERVEKAVEAVKQLAEQREKRKKGDGETARASTTDPDARRMKMGDGGTRPAYNVQMATDADSGIILNMDVINVGSDAGQMEPMMKEIENDLGQRPKSLLADGGFSTIEDIEATEAGGTQVFVPIKEEAKKIAAGKNPFEARPSDSPVIAAWRERMGTDAAKELYKRRAPAAELPNARLRNQGVYQIAVRGLEKVKAVLWWHVLALNWLRAQALRTQILKAAQ